MEDLGKVDDETETLQCFLVYCPHAVVNHERRQQRTHQEDLNIGVLAFFERA